MNDSYVPADSLRSRFALVTRQASKARFCPPRPLRREITREKATRRKRYDFPSRCLLVHRVVAARRRSCLSLLAISRLLAFTLRRHSPICWTRYRSAIARPTKAISRRWVWFRRANKTFLSAACAISERSRFAPAVDRCCRSQAGGWRPDSSCSKARAGSRLRFRSSGS